MILLCKSESYIWLFVIPWTIAARLSYPRNSPGKNTGVGCHALLQGIFPTQGLNLGIPHCGQILYHLSHSNSGCQMLQQQPSLPLTPEGPTRSPGSHGPSGRAACTTAWTCGRVFSCSGSHQNSQLFNPWIGRIPWRRETLPTPVFWPGEFQGLNNPWDFTGKNTEVGYCFLLQGSSQPRDWTWVSCTAGRLFTLWATREAPITGILY